MKLKYNLNSNSNQKGKTITSVSVLKFWIDSSLPTDDRRPSVDYNGTKKYTLDEAIYLSG